MKPAEKVVSYFYDEEIGNYCYGGGNPMRPHRARMCYSLVDSYGLTNKMMVQRPRPREFEELTQFHADDYVNFLRGVTPNTVDENMTQLRRFNMGIAGEADCPVFDGLYEYCQVYSGGSVDGAAQLASGAAEVAFNWSGGMHHAKKAEASGFCYVNDIVMAILELLKTYARVLYVDIDIHHGDGVEEAFYLTDRVMTVSFHKYGEFFPGTGALDDIGYGKGKFYTANVPLKDGMDDDSYRMVYEPIMRKVMEMYQPGAIVMCCGADSLSGDRLGCFNLSLEGHSNCLEFLAKFNVPMLILGGGGYTLRNVARCWCYETGRMMNIDLPDGLPEKALDDFNMYLDTQRLRIAVSNMKNANERQELEQIKIAVLEHLSRLPPVPSVQMAYVPARMGRERPEEGLPEKDLDVRGGGAVHDAVRRVRDGDESDCEEGNGRRGFGDDTSSLHGGKLHRRFPAEGASPTPGAAGRAMDQSEDMQGLQTQTQAQLQQPSTLQPQAPLTQQPLEAAAGGQPTPTMDAGPRAPGSGGGNLGSVATAPPGVVPLPAAPTASAPVLVPAPAPVQPPPPVPVPAPRLEPTSHLDMIALARSQQHQAAAAAAAAAMAAVVSTDPSTRFALAQQFQQQLAVRGIDGTGNVGYVGPTANGGFVGFGGDGAAAASAAAAAAARMQQAVEGVSDSQQVAAAAAAVSRGLRLSGSIGLSGGYSAAPSNDLHGPYDQ